MDIYYRKTLFELGYVLLDGMSCRREHIAGYMFNGGHLLLEDMSFMGTYLNPMH